MSKSLIITEKPSVAGDIAKALGGFKKGKDYFENELYLISWAIGHLFELASRFDLAIDRSVTGILFRRPFLVTGW